QAESQRGGHALHIPGIVNRQEPALGAQRGVYLLGFMTNDDDDRVDLACAGGAEDPVHYRSPFVRQQQLMTPHARGAPRRQDDRRRQPPLLRHNLPLSYDLGSTSTVGDLCVIARPVTFTLLANASATMDVPLRCPRRWTSRTSPPAPLPRG